MLDEGRLDEIAALSDESPNVVSAVVSRLYAADALTRFRAADALGRVASRLIATRRGRVEELLKKLAWSLNEESGATAWGAPHAIGEVARCDSELAREYTPLLVSYLNHDETYLETDIMVHGVVHALGRVCAKYPEMGSLATESLIPLVRDDDAITRMLAAWALGCTGDGRAREPLAQVTGDATPVERYVDGRMESTDVGTVAREALASLPAG